MSSAAEAAEELPLLAQRKLWVYLLVPVLLAPISGLCAIFGGQPQQTLSTIGWLLYGMLGVWISLVDLRTRIIPNRLVYSLTIGLVIYATFQALGYQSAASLLQVLIGAVAVTGVYFLFAMFLGLGLGDVKFALASALVLGLSGMSWNLQVALIIVPFVMATPEAIVRALRGQRQARIAFGPYIFCGTLLIGALFSLASPH